MQWSCPDLIGSPSPYTDGKATVQWACLGARESKKVKESGVNGNKTDQVYGKMMVRISGMASTDQTRLDRERERENECKKLVQIYLI